MVSRPVEGLLKFENKVGDGCDNACRPVGPLSGRVGLTFFARVPSDDSSGVDYDPFRIFPPVFLDCKFFSEWTVLIIVLK